MIATFEESLRTLRVALESEEDAQVRAAELALMWCGGFAFQRASTSANTIDGEGQSLDGSDLACVLGDVLKTDLPVYSLDDPETPAGCHRLMTLLLALDPHLS
ncbi:MAG: hypothetical protein AAF735_02385 [Myxococcota bacterium]